MMTPVRCADKVADFLRDAFADYVPTDEKIKANGMNVYSCMVPRVATPAEKAKQDPYICVKPVVVLDESEDSSVALQITVTIRQDDVKDAALEIYHVMEKIRETLLTKRTAKGAPVLVLPMKITIPGEQLYPEWVGLVEATYHVGQYKEQLFGDDLK